MEGTPVLADFGLANLSEIDTVFRDSFNLLNLGGTRWMAPEILTVDKEKIPVSMEADVWAFANVILVWPFLRELSYISSTITGSHSECDPVCFSHRRLGDHVGYSVRENALGHIVKQNPFVSRRRYRYAWPIYQISKSVETLYTLLGSRAFATSYCFKHSRMPSSGKNERA